MTDALDTQGRVGGRWRLFLWGGIAGLLLAPLVAMRFTDQVNWTGIDFAFAGALLGGAGLASEAAVRWLRRPLQRAAAAAVILGAVLLVWAEGAVGLF